MGNLTQEHLKSALKPLKPNCRDVKDVDNGKNKSSLKARTALTRFVQN